MNEEATSRVYLNDSYLHRYQGQLKRYQDLMLFKKKAAMALDRPAAQYFWEPIQKLPQFKSQSIHLDTDILTIGAREELNDEDHDHLLNALKALMPWRKGPYSYFGTMVDSEWQSHLKWNRIIQHVQLENRVVADVGCNNTYYMYKMLPYRPHLVIGMEPLDRYFFHYQLNQRFIQSDLVKFELMGVEHLPLFENFFDTILLMGILYHRRNPIQTLEHVYTALKPFGQLILEGAGIPGDESMCLFPQNRYLKSKGYWFLPTVSALVAMLERTQFYHIEVFHICKLEINEQRKTDWVNTESLGDFLDPNDPTKTIEGYPAPIRIYIKAVKKVDIQTAKDRKRLKKQSTQPKALEY